VLACSGRVAGDFDNASGFITGHPARIGLSLKTIRILGENATVFRRPRHHRSAVQLTGCGLVGLLALNHPGQYRRTRQGKYHGQIYHQFHRLSPQTVDKRGKACARQSVRMG